MVLEMAKTKTFTGFIKSACGSTLKIESKLENIEVIILDEKFSFSPLITEENPKYAIIGVDVLIKNPNLINRIIKTKFPETNAIEVNEIINKKNKEEERILREYDFMFKDKIDKDKACLIKKHQIDTGRSEPVYVKSGRVPIHFKTAVEQEIKKNLELGIIR